MTIYTTKFIYGNHSSEEYGTFKCTIETVGDSNDEQTSIITSKIPYKKKFDFHYLNYTDPLTFKLTICNQDGAYIDADKERILKKWLCKESRDWLQFDQADIVDCYYFCAIHNPKKISAASMTIGMEFDVECDSGFAWSQLYQKQYTTSSGSLNFKFYNQMDFSDYILSPTFYITPIANGTISIKNNTTNQTMIINNCVTTEVITMDNEEEKFESTNGRIILDDWNKINVDFKDGMNDVVLTGNFKLKIEYRLPIRIGG